MRDRINKSKFERDFYTKDTRRNKWINITQINRTKTSISFSFRTPYPVNMNFFRSSRCSQQHISHFNFIRIRAPHPLKFSLSCNRAYFERIQITYVPVLSLSYQPFSPSCIRRESWSLGYLDDDDRGESERDDDEESGMLESNWNGLPSLKKIVALSGWGEKWRWSISRYI